MFIYDCKRRVFYIHLFMVRIEIVLKFINTIQDNQGIPD